MRIEDTGRVSPGVHRRYVREGHATRSRTAAANKSGIETISFGAIAELAIRIVAPAVHLTIDDRRVTVDQGTGMPIAPRGLHDVRQRDTVDSGDAGDADLRRQLTAGVIADAELTAAVLSPTENSGVRHDGAGVILSCRDVDCANKRRRRTAVEASIGNVDPLPGLANRDWIVALN